MPENVTAALGAAGDCQQVEWDGRRWTVGPHTQHSKSCVEQACIAAASAEVRKAKAALPPDEYAELHQAFLDRVSGQHYATHAEGWWKMLAGRRAAAINVYALVKPHHPEFTLDMADRMLAAKEDEVMVAVVAVYPGFFDLLMEGARAPAEQVAALKAEALATLARR